MEFGEKLKDIHFKGEEKWYNTLDKIDSHVPIYSVVDRIDEIVPSFALLIVLAIILLLLVGISAFGLTQTSAVLKLSVVDSRGNGIENASVTIEGLNNNAA